jgi:DNA polymerase-3 subunit beta
MLELKVKKDELLKGMSQTQSIAEKRSSMPILSNVLLDVVEGRLVISATDLEITFKGSYEAEILSEGRLTVPARKFYEIVKVLSDDTLTLTETENHGLRIKGSRSKYQLNGLSPEDFPQMPEFEGVSFIRLPGETLGGMIEKTIYSVAMEETRYNLAGVYFEKVDVGDKGLIRMVSTDGHRLSYVERQVGDTTSLALPKGVILSRKGVIEIRKLSEEAGEVELGFTSNSVVFKTPNVVLVSRLLEGRFPDYNLVLPKKNDKVMLVGRKDFLEMLRRVSVMTGDEHKGVKFTISPKELTLSTVNPDLGEARESLPVEYEGEELEMGFNPRYYIEAVSPLAGDLVRMAFQDVGNPCEVKSADEPGFTGVIMPMKI